MTPLRVLIGFEESGIVRDAFAMRGHDAWSCDLVPSRIHGQHILGDVRRVLSWGWHLAIFFPPCQYLAVSGLHWNKRDPDRARLTEEALALVRLIMAAPIPMIAVENPVGCISSRIRKPSQIIQPHDFGEDASKKTCLWLKGLPPLKPTRFFPPRMVCQGCGAHNVFAKPMPPCACGSRRMLPRWGNQTDSGQNKLSPSEDRARLRAITYPGVAEAMAETWGGPFVVPAAPDLFAGALT